MKDKGEFRMARRKKPAIQHAEIVRRFAERLRKLRRDRGLTQAELARRAAISESYVRRLESAGAARGSTCSTGWPRPLGPFQAIFCPRCFRPTIWPFSAIAARELLDGLMDTEDRQTLSLLTQFLARLSETTPR